MVIFFPIGKTHFWTKPISKSLTTSLEVLYCQECSNVLESNAISSIDIVVGGVMVKGNLDHVDGYSLHITFDDLFHEFYSTNDVCSHVCDYLKIKKILYIAVWNDYIVTFQNNPTPTFSKSPSNASPICNLSMLHYVSAYLIKCPS